MKTSQTRIRVIRRADVQDQRGSLSLEHVLFIGAVVALSAALFGFYGKLSQYFTDIDIDSVPTSVGAPGYGSGTSGSSDTSGSSS